MISPSMALRYFILKLIIIEIYENFLSLIIRLWKIKYIDVNYLRNNR